MSQDCGCCSVVSVDSTIENRPWLSAVAYRSGTFASFRQALIEELSHTPELAGLSARVSDDYTITAIELWAAVADVITFYQERIANEAFLRTAMLRDSMLRLVRLIDYQLAPGAATTTQLAFTLEAGARAMIVAGTRSQSVPAEGEKPQTFETSAPLMADARLNRLRLAGLPVRVTPTAAGISIATVAPDADAIANAATLAPGDRVALYAANALEELTVRDVTVREELLQLQWQSPIHGSSFTQAFDASNPRVRAMRMARTFHLFGYDSPSLVVVSALTNPLDPKTAVLTQAQTSFALAPADVTDSRLSLDARYAGLKPGTVLLAVASSATVTNVLPFVVQASTEASVQQNATGVAPVVTTTVRTGTVTQLTLASFTTSPAYTLANLLPAGSDIRSVVIHELVGDPLRFWPYEYSERITSRDVLVPGRRAGWSSLEVGRTIERGKYKAGTDLDIADLAIGRAVLLTDASGHAPVAATIAAASIGGTDLSTEPTVADPLTIRTLGLAPDQAAMITALVSAPLSPTLTLAVSSRELMITIGAHPAMSIVLGAALPSPASLAQIAAALQGAIRAAVPSSPSFAQACVGVMGANSLVVTSGLTSDVVSFAPTAADPNTVVTLGLDPQRTRWADGLLSAPVTSLGGIFAGEVSVQIGVDAPVERAIGGSPGTVAQMAALLTAQWPVSAMARDDQRYVLFANLAEREIRSYARLSLASEQLPALDRETATLLGNVAAATHGETVRNEIVGDGDASRAFQKFTLRKKPMTYTPAAVPGGIESSLSLLVNGVRWSERPTLYGAAGDEQIYVAHTADDGTTSIQFGDGVTGARVPTGRQNIVATYRQGLGVGGRVAATKIRTLLDRPTGVKGVTNLLAADGGADPESMARARVAAPGTVRTFGRAVSLRDFEDSALMAGEVAKAVATWVWTGERRAIHLTIAPQGGGTFSADGLRRISATLLAARDPNHRLLVSNYVSVPIVVDAAIIVDGRYVAADVIAAARAALLADLAFEQRRFAQPVYLSEVFALLQNVSGVVAVDVNTLDLKSTDSMFRAAHGVDPAAGQPQPHVLMLPARPDGSGGVLPAELACIDAPVQDFVLRATGGIGS